MLAIGAVSIESSTKCSSLSLFSLSQTVYTVFLSVCFSICSGVIRYKQLI